MFFSAVFSGAAAGFGDPVGETLSAGGEVGGPAQWGAMIRWLRLKVKQVYLSGDGKVCCWLQPAEQVRDSGVK